MNTVNNIEAAVSKRLQTNEIVTREKAQSFFSLFGVLPDPDPILRKLGKDAKAFKDILSDSHVFSAVQQRKSAVQSMMWEIEKDKAGGRELNFVKEAFGKLDMDAVINSLLNAPLFGFTVLEVIWKMEDSYFIPFNIVEKPNEWFIFDKENNLKFKTLSNPSGEELPERKFILSQFNAGYDNPYGERLLSKCFWPVTFKRGGLKFWATMTEKYGMPFILGKQPRGAGEQSARNMLMELENMAQDAVAVVPDDSSVEIIEGDKESSSALYEGLLNFCNSEISKAILTQTLTTEVQDKGSYAASNTHSSMLARLADSDKKLVEKALNMVICWMVDANFGGGKYPRFAMYREEEVDLNLANRDKILHEQGVRLTREYYQRAYNLQEDEFELHS
jgi:phage gp29-like protein